MVNPFKEINWSPDTRERRKFAVSLMVGFPIIAVLFLIAARLKTGAWSPVVPLWIGGAGFGAGLLFYLLPAIALPFYLAWYAVAACIGLVVGNVLLGLVFYVGVTLIGFGLRVFGKRPIAKYPDPNAKTYWLEANQPDDPTQYYRQF